ncbi:uncharacterized protein LOC109838911 [Asparagus officinalis]|uniref:uncharacterized protein LOC109838911 n=1 Tax=Asparagus officinalis TaxID=4686 RepID=UPI00098DF075|nr:uncharacterized protein LOC109838911 [Asparagus officinalis]
MNGLCDRYMKQAPNEVPAEIANNPNYFSYFKDCIGMIDGTHVDAVLPSNLVAHFRGRKEDPNDDILNENIDIDEDNGEVTNEDDSSVVDYTQTRTQREDRDERNEWKELRDQIAWAMWVDYCAKYNGSNTMKSGLA